MTTIRLFAKTGEFAGDKDIAREIRERMLKPLLLEGESVVINFSSVELATQSFVHALISELVRTTQFDALDLITFSDCNPVVRELIEIVTDYSQEDVVGGLAVGEDE